MTEPDKWRSRALRGLEEYFRKRGFPRLTLGLVLLLTGLTGFGISFFLLRAGIGDMWVRYPVAVVGAYGIFLVLMRLWVELERRQFDPEDPIIREAMEDDRPTPVFTGSKGDGSWLDWLDLPSDLLSFDEGCLPVILIGVVIGLLGLLLAALLGAPALIAEVFIDAFLTGVLYRRLKIAAYEHWLGTCIRKTWLFVLGTAFLLFIGGLGLSVMAPGTQTIGAALEIIFQPKK